MPGGDRDLEDRQGRRGRHGVGPETLRNCPNKYREAKGGADAELTLTERARLKELERVVADLRAETAFLKKASAYFAREQRP